MPANVNVAFVEAEKEYEEARTNEEKLKALKKMLSVAPKHKGTEKMLAEIKAKISKLQKIIQREKQLKRKGKPTSIRKQGAATVCLFSLPNTGKSYLMNMLTGSNIPSTLKPFETVEPKVGMIDYDGVKIQLVELPSVFEGYHKKYPNYMSIARVSDLIAILGDPKIPTKELEQAGVKVPTVLITPENAKDLIWKKLDLIRVYTKEPGKSVTKEAMGLKRGSRVIDAAERIHKDFVKKFKYARIWGKSASFPGQTVGPNHVLEDGDVIEIHTKK